MRSPGRYPQGVDTLDSKPPDSQMDRLIAPKPAWRRYGPYVAGGALALGIAAWALISTPQSTYRVPINQLTFATVTEGPFEDFIAVRGTVAPLITAYLTTNQGGTVEQTLVEDGAMVKNGQPLIILSNPALQLQVAAQQLVFEQTRFAYERNLLEIEHEISKLKANLARDKILLDGNAIAPSTYKEQEEEYNYYLRLRAATIASRDTEQRVRATELIGGNRLGKPGSQQDVANAGVEALTIRAPMDGQLTALDAYVGQSKAQGAVLGQVNSADRFKLKADVDEFYLGQVVVGQQTLFSVDGRDYQAKVAKIYPQVSNGTFKVDLYFESAAPPNMHVGQAIDLKVELGGNPNAIVILNGPFYQSTGGNWAFVVGPTGTEATKRNIRLGRKNPKVIEVLDGLKPGEKVIISGYEAYQKMDRIEFEQSDRSAETTESRRQ
jgi:HlyD family secretion protein